MSWLSAVYRGAGIPKCTDVNGCGLSNFEPVKKGRYVGSRQREESDTGARSSSALLSDISQQALAFLPSTS